MRTAREQYVTLIVAAIAVLVIIGGFASFTGLSAYDEPLRIEMEGDSFSQGDVFDADVVVNPVTFMADESLMIYVDGNAVGVVALKKYLDDNALDYGTEVKNLGQNNAEIITLSRPLSVSLADYISVAQMHPGTTHILRVEFSRGDAAAEEVFKIL